MAIRLLPFRLSTGKLSWESNFRAVKGKEDINMYWGAGQFISLLPQRKGKDLSWITEHLSSIWLDFILHKGNFTLKIGFFHIQF